METHYFTETAFVDMPPGFHETLRWAWAILTRAQTTSADWGPWAYGLAELGTIRDHVERPIGTRLRT
jgi:hypothetical protein